jgi:acyl-CoA hydrolase
LIKSERIHIDAVFIQVTPPNEEGYCSLGVAVDVARYAMDQASIVIGEINPDTPFTFGDTFIHINEFDYLVEATEKPIYMDRWPVDSVQEKVAENVASRIEDGSCLSFSTGPLFEALGKLLIHKRHIGIHSPVFTDALMELVRSGAVTNRKKGVFRENPWFHMPSEQKTLSMAGSKSFGGISGDRKSVQSDSYRSKSQICGAASCQKSRFDRPDRTCIPENEMFPQARARP